MKFKDLDDVLKLSLLFDFYGALLTSRQEEIMRLYHEENFNIVEISSELGITKQGVHDALKKGEKLLYSYEEKLSLIDKFLYTEEKIKEIEKIVDSLDIDSKKKEDIKNIISSIED